MNDWNTTANHPVAKEALMWVFEGNDSSSFHCLISFTSESPCKPLVLLKKATSLQWTLLLRTARPAVLPSADSLVSCTGPTRVHISMSGRQNCMIYNAGSLCLATLFLHPSGGGEIAVRGSTSVKRLWNWLHVTAFTYSNICRQDSSPMQRVITARVSNESTQKREMKGKRKQPPNHREELKEASIRSLKVSIYIPHLWAWEMMDSHGFRFIIKWENRALQWTHIKTHALLQISLCELLPCWDSTSSISILAFLHSSYNRSCARLG